MSKLAPGQFIFALQLALLAHYKCLIKVLPSNVHPIGTTMSSMISKGKLKQSTDSNYPSNSSYQSVVSNIVFVIGGQPLKYWALLVPL